MPAKLRLMRFALILLLALSVARVCAADLAVVVHPESGIDSMSREEVSHLFLGRIKQLPSGVPAVVIETAPLRDAFYRALVGRGVAEIDAYWARLRFSGRTQPPLRAEDAFAVLDRIARDRSAIGYVDVTQLDSRVKMVLRLDD